jgi:hypothetical protein
VAMPTKPCMVMLRTGVDGGRYQEDGAVGCGARVSDVCVCVCPCALCVSASLTSLRLSLRKNRRRRETDSMIILQ